MTRLTEKGLNLYLVKEETANELGIDMDNQDLGYITTMQQKLIQTLCNKLGKLEDLEEELKCPLNVVINAMQNGFYDKNGKHYVTHCQDIEIRLNLDENLYYGILEVYEVKSYTPVTYVLTENFWVSDYKKSWWLKKNREE